MHLQIQDKTMAIGALAGLHSGSALCCPAIPNCAMQLYNRKCNLKIWLSHVITGKCKKFRVYRVYPRRSLD